MSETPEDRQFHEARLKFIHDQEGRLIAAREEGYKEGFEQGLREVLAERIQRLQELLGEEPTDLKKLQQRSSQELEVLFSELQQRAREQS